MRVAMISDLHGNLTALEIVLEDMSRGRPDRVVCLGDAAATGPQPRETVERLRELECPVVMGNADDELLRPLSVAKVGDDARKVAEIDRWCSEQLSPEHLDFIRGFPPTLNVSLGPDDLLCFHGSPRSFDDVIVAATPDGELDRMISGHEAPVMAGGHTHEQLLRRHGETTLVNPGSVGLGPPVAAYAFVSSENGRLEVEFRRLPLDVTRIRRVALDGGMPHAEWWASFWEV